jgi:CubicO group peptidase (beta-lactamase class C family)
VESIEPFVLDQLAAWEVPGCSVAAVRDGRVVLAAGWGQRDLGAELPVTPNTLFAIGSTTKAFTAAAVGALVEDGLLDWQRPLRDYLPELRLSDSAVADRVSIEDLLCHRSGLPRHDLAWLGHPERTRADLVRRLRFLPLSQDLRQGFQYCNLGYLAAGYAIEALSGTSWEDFLRARLLTPIGMADSNLSVDDLNAGPDHATAYERRRGTVVEVRARPITAMAPAGAINSSAADMARWLLAQLGGGQLDGRTVISSDTMARQHMPHMLVPEDRTFPASTRHAYGLGWMIGRYREHRLHEHGGGIDGFLTECMLLPDDGIGVVVMTNTSSSAMAPVVAYRVLDELLGLPPLDWFSDFKARHDAATAGISQARGARRVVREAGLPRTLDSYVGEYEHPGYGRSPSPSKTAPSDRSSARWTSPSPIGTTRHSTSNGMSSATSRTCSRSCSCQIRTATSRPAPSRSSLRLSRCDSTGYPMGERPTPSSCAGSAGPTGWVQSSSWSARRAAGR